MKRLAQIDALRGIAAFAVVLYHAFGFRYGERGVTLFFVISGFVILVSIRSKARLGEFAWARFVRLFPLYWASMAVAVVAMLLSGDGGALSIERIAANATMMPLLFQRLAADAGSLGWRRFDFLDSCYWTLIYELCFYVLAGMAILVLRIRRPELPCLVWLAAAAFERLTKPIAPPWDVLLTTSTNYAECFVIGIVAYRLYRREATWLTLVAALAAEALALIGFEGELIVKYPVLIGGCGMTVWAASRGWLRPLDWAPIRFLGRISYALYLTHDEVGRVFVWLMGAPLTFSGRLLWLVSALVLAAALTFLVERPAHDALIGLVGRRRAVPLAPP